MDPVSAYLSQVCRESPPSEDEGPTLPRQDLIMRNTRLVVSVAKRYTGRGLPFRDLVQEGVIGLIQAVDAWDPERGRLSTYAVPRIRRAIVNALKLDRTMTVPRNAVDDLGRLASVASGLIQVTGIEPTVTELAQETGLEPGYIQALRKAARVSSLDAELEGGDALLSLLGDDGVEERALAAAICSHTDELETRARDVVRRRWLMGHTQQRIADDYGVTRQRISQIEHEGLELLREILGITPDR